MYGAFLKNYELLKKQNFFGKILMVAKVRENRKILGKKIGQAFREMSANFKDDRGKIKCEKYVI